jgi:hypothetical protein
MTMPVMEPDLDAGVLREWARAVDGGPFSSLCWGERMAFDNPETLTLMGALAAWTDRVRLVTTVIVPQLHDPVMLAKAGVTNRVTGSTVRHPGEVQHERDAMATEITQRTTNGLCGSSGLHA